MLLTAAGYISPDVDIDVRTWPRLSSTLEILIIVVLMAILLFTVAYTLDIQDGVIFASFLVALIGLGGGLLGTGFGGYLGFIGANNRRPLLLAAFVVAFLFPFTQDGSDANMSIATQVLIFAATALGLNIVVGLAGLLDLGYIAFLGTGAYVAADAVELGASPRSAGSRRSSSSCSSAPRRRPRSASSSARRRCGSRATTSPS